MSNHHPVQVPKCLNPECAITPPLAARGLCGHCYAQARVAVSRGETTWAKLEAAGLARPTFRCTATKPGADWLKRASLRGLHAAARRRVQKPPT